MQGVNMWRGLTPKIKAHVKTQTDAASEFTDSRNIKGKAVSEPRDINQEMTC